MSANPAATLRSVGSSSITLLAVLLSGFGCAKHTDYRKGTEQQIGMVKTDGFLSSPEKGALENYARAVALLENAGWTYRKLRRSSEDSLPNEGSEAEVFESVLDLVLIGATKQRVYLPRIGKYQTEVNVEGFGLDLIDLHSPAYACMMMVRDMERKKEYKEALHISKAVLAFGLQLWNCEDTMVRAIGLSCCKKALESIRQIAQSTSDLELAKLCDALLVKTQEQFLVFRDQATE